MPEATKNQTDNPPLRCDTCGQLSERVSRVVVDNDYNRANAPPISPSPASSAPTPASVSASGGARSSDANSI